MISFTSISSFNMANRGFLMTQYLMFCLWSLFLFVSCSFIVMNQVRGVQVFFFFYISWCGKFKNPKNIDISQWIWRLSFWMCPKANEQKQQKHT